MKKTHLMISGLCAAMLAATACTTPPPPQPPEQPMQAVVEAAPAGPDFDKRPKLTVLISVDQLRYDYMTRLYPHFEEGGFKRLLDGGALFANAHYLYATTYTGPGHATQSTGAYGYRHGIVGNKFYYRDKKKAADPMKDKATKLLGVEKEKTGSSPRALFGDTIGDALHIATGMQSKVVTIALKDRAAVLLGGKFGKAFWFDDSVGNFVTSTYYHDAMPEWADAFNKARHPDKALGKDWVRRGPEAAFALATADDVPFESNKEGLGKTFPRKVSGKNNALDKSFFKAWTLTPYAIEAELELVKAAIEAEGLGADDVPDLLGVGVTTTDYVGHSYGPYSHEMISTIFEVDAFIKNLLTYLDSKVGEGQYSVVLTADHGACPIPEHMASIGLDAGRLKKGTIKDAVNKALTDRYGKGEWVVSLQDPSVFLDWDLIAKKKLDRAEVQETAAVAARALEGVEAVYTHDQLLRGAILHTPISQAVARSFHPARSGDVIVITKPFWFWGKYGEKDGGTTHGSANRYDTHVPLVFYGAGIKQGVHAHQVEMVDLAPTLSHLLSITAPSMSQGRVLTEALGDR